MILSKSEQIDLIKHAQDILELTPDGIIGSETIRELDRISLIKNFDIFRKIVWVIQSNLFYYDFNITLDGYWGPQTEAAYMEYTNEDRWRDVQQSSGQFPNERSVREFYGEPGENLKRFNSPYPLKLAWAPEKMINSFLCHELVIPSLVVIFEDVMDAYTPFKIDKLKLNMWGGCLSSPPRKKRGGSQLSMHSWGIAIDWNPAENRLKWGNDKATLASYEYDEWWEIWESHGWTSLGRSKNYDWQHCQAAGL